MADDSRTQVTQLLARIGADDGAVESLLPLVYAELRSTADRLMRREQASHTLQPTALVHEVYLRLVEGEAGLGSGRRHFLAIAARAMRNLLVDHARERKAEKRGGDRQHVTLSGVADSAPADAVAADEFELLDLNQALEQLEQLDERQARIVEMSYFAGMTGDEIADELGVHRNTVVRELRMARAWLLRELQN